MLDEKREGDDEDQQHQHQQQQQLVQSVESVVEHVARETVSSYTRKLNGGVPPATRLVPQPVPVRVQAGEPETRPSAGFQRTGLLPRLLDSIDTAAAAAKEGSELKNRSKCGVCRSEAAGDTQQQHATRLCAGECGGWAHLECCEELKVWFCTRWKCQARRRVRDKALRSQNADVVLISDLDKPKEATETPQSPNAAASGSLERNEHKAQVDRAWKYLSACFSVDDYDKCRCLLEPSQVSAEIYEVPHAQYDYRELFADEDRRWALIDKTPRNMRYKQRRDSDIDANGIHHICPTMETSGRIDRCSLIWSVFESGEQSAVESSSSAEPPLDSQSSMASSSWLHAPSNPPKQSLPQDWSFRALQRSYAEATGLVLPSDKSNSESSKLQLDYVFPPPLYEPLSARFYVPGSASPLDVPGSMQDERQTLDAETLSAAFHSTADFSPIASVAAHLDQPGTPMHKQAKQRIDLDGFERHQQRLSIEPFLKRENDDEICCELWLLRRQLEAQVRRNNCIKAKLAGALSADAKIVRNCEEERQSRRRVFELYKESQSSKPQPDSPRRATMMAAAQAAEEASSENASAAVDQSTMVRETSVAAKPTKATPFRHGPVHSVLSIDDMCRIMAERHVLMSRPPTIATIVDCFTTNLLVEEQIMATQAAIAHVRNYRLQREQLERERVQPHADQIAVRQVLRLLMDDVERLERAEMQNANKARWRSEPILSSTSQIPVVDDDEIAMVDEAVASCEKVPRSEFVLNDPVRYCVCDRPDDATQWFISCDECESWFHGRCCNFNDAHADYIQRFVCRQCHEREGFRTQLHQSYLQRILPVLARAEASDEAAQSRSSVVQLSDAMDSLASLTVHLHRRAPNEYSVAFVSVDGFEVQFDRNRMRTTRSVSQSECKFVAARIAVPCASNEKLKPQVPPTRSVEKAILPLRRSRRGATDLTSVLNKLPSRSTVKPSSSLKQKCSGSVAPDRRRRAKRLVSTAPTTPAAKRSRPARSSSNITPR